MNGLLQTVVSLTFTLFASNLQAGLVRSDTDIALYRELAQLPDFDCVVQVDERGPSATGIIIAAKWMLTAAHIAEAPGDPFFGGQQYKRIRTVFHPEWRSPVNSTEWIEDLVKGTDMALIELDRPVTTLAAAQRYRGGDEFGEAGTLVGWGYVGTLADGPIEPVRQEKVAGRNVIENTPTLTIGSILPQFTDRILVYDADDPLDPNASTLGSPQALPLEYFASEQDSGSGLFLEEDGEWYLAGIDKAGGHPITGEQIQTNGVHGFIEIYGRVTSSNEWIDSVLPENAHDEDEDGLWDRWEIMQFGGMDQQSGYDDPDFDGQANTIEFVAGTDPTSSSSQFFTYIVPREPSGVGIVFGPVRKERLYTIELSPDLAENSWSPLVEYTADSDKDSHVLILENASDAVFARTKISYKILP